MIEINLLPGDSKKKRRTSTGGAKFEFHPSQWFAAITAKVTDKYLLGAIGAAGVSGLLIALMVIHQTASGSSLGAREAIVLVYRALAMEGFSAIESGRSILIVPEGKDSIVTNFQDKLKPVGESLVKELGVGLLFSMGDAGAIFVDPSLDITLEVIKRYERKLGSAEALRDETVCGMARRCRSAIFSSRARPS